MTTIHVKPPQDGILAARRQHTVATMRVAAGVAVSIAGIATLAGMMLVILPALGSSPTIGQGVGVLLLAAVAFAASAWGTDLRHVSVKRRRIARALISRLEAN